VSCLLAGIKRRGCWQGCKGEDGGGGTGRVSCMSSCGTPSELHETVQVLQVVMSI